MELLIIGVVTFLNLLFIKVKYERKRYEDAFFDLALLVLLSLVFGGSFSGLVVATVTSLLLSIYFFFSPPTFFRNMIAHFK